MNLVELRRVDRLGVARRAADELRVFAEDRVQAFLALLRPFRSRLRVGHERADEGVREEADRTRPLLNLLIRVLLRTDLVDA